MRVCIITAALLFSAHNIAARSCPTTISQQATWTNANIDLLIQSARTAYEKESGESSYKQTLNRIANTIKQCKLGEDEGFARRYSTFLEYIRVLSLEQQKDHELGFEVPDQVYFAETQSYVTIPAFLLATEFLQAVKHFETLPKAKALLRAMNEQRSQSAQLLFFSFVSRHLGTPDNDFSYRRLLVVVPGDPLLGIPEKWVQFGITDPRKKTPVRNLSVVAVAPGSNNNANTYFKDYFRTYRRDGSVTIKGRWELGYGDDNCVKCHKSGVLPIFPEDGSVSEDEKAVVEAVNQRFLRYGAPRFGRYLDQTKFGPGLGSTTFTINNHRLATNCSSCHQPNGVGSLSWPMDSVLISSFVEGGRMPLGSNLKTWESSELYEQLIDDYFSIDPRNPGILKSWLTNDRNFGVR